MIVARVPPPSPSVCRHRCVHIPARGTSPGHPPSPARHPPQRPEKHTTAQIKISLGIFPVRPATLLGGNANAWLDMSRPWPWLENEHSSHTRAVEDVEPLLQPARHGVRIWRGGWNSAANGQAPFSTDLEMFGVCSYYLRLSHSAGLGRQHCCAQPH